MPDKRKEYIRDFYTELMREHIRYADIENDDPKSEALWAEYISRVDEIIDKFEKTAGATDIYIMRKLFACQVAAIEKQSLKRAGKI